jgi:Short C-terminal domain
MPRRMGRPGLMGTMARTAVIAGTATAVSGSVSRSQQQKAAGQQQAAAAQQQAMVDQAAAQAAAQVQAQQAPAPATTAADDTMAQIQKLGELKAAGLLTDEEFAAAKAKALGI